MLDLSSINPTLRLHAARFHDDSLPPELKLPAFAKFDRKAFSRREVKIGRFAWQHRTLDEYRSMVGLSEFLDELGQLGLAFEGVTTAVRVVRDEARHVELGRRMVVALGGNSKIPGEPEWVRSDRRQPLLERVLNTVIGSLCVGETISVALLAATRDVTDEPLTKAVLTQFTRDEAIHSQLGWTLLPVLWPIANKTLQRRMLASVDENLEYSEQMALAPDDLGPRSRNPFGDLLGSERQEAFFQCVERNIRRRLVELGLTSGSRRSRRGRSTSARRTKGAAGS
jgi:hypothetical protein